jgi:hypothetical protein
MKLHTVHAFVLRLNRDGDAAGPADDRQAGAQPLIVEHVAVCQQHLQRKESER